jgi:hypothetical protein
MHAANWSPEVCLLAVGELCPADGVLLLLLLEPQAAITTPAATIVRMAAKRVMGQ